MKDTDFTHSHLYFGIQRIRRGAFAAAFLFAIADTAAAQTHGTWTSDIPGGDWSDATHWSGGKVADGAGALANFSTIDLAAGNFGVILDSARTVGSLRFGDTDIAGSPGTWALNGSATLTLEGNPVITTEVDAAFGGSIVLGGWEGFVKEGSGLLNLTNAAASTLSGVIEVKAGTLRVNGAAAGSSTILLRDGTRVNFADFQSTPIEVASGAHVRVAASGYTGIISGPEDSVVEIAAASSFGALRTQQFGGFQGTVLIPQGSNLRISATSGNANGNGGADALFDVRGTIFTRNVAHQDGVYLGAVTGNGILSGQTNAAVGTVIYRIGDKNLDTTFSGTFVNGANGTTSIHKVGTGTLTLTGDSPATGAVTIGGGTLEVGDGGDFGSLAHVTLDVSTGASLVFNRGGLQSVPGVISGAGAVIKRGPGTTAFTSSGNLHVSGTVIEEGTLAISSDSHLGDAAGSVRFPVGEGFLAADAAGVVIDRTIEFSGPIRSGLAATDAVDSLVVKGSITGSGGFLIAGEGVVEIQGAHEVSGGLTVRSGTLVVANESGSATGSSDIEVLDGAALGGGGSVTGAVNVAAGGGLRPGGFSPTTSATGTLKAGSLSLAAGAVLNLDFSAAGHDAVELNGSLSASGASPANPVLVDLRLAGSTARWSQPGTYPLITTGSPLPANIAGSFKVTSDSSHPSRTYQFVAVGNSLVLEISGAAPSKWLPDADGSWHTAGNWSTGVPNGDGIPAGLGGVITAPRTVSLNSGATVGELTFESSHGYTIQGTGTLRFQNESSASLLNVAKGNQRVSAPVQLSTQGLELFVAGTEDSVTLDGLLSGSGPLAKASPGVVALRGNNVGFSGDIQFQGGGLSFRNGSLGTGKLHLDDTTLNWESGNTQDITLGRAVSFGEGVVAFDLAGDVSLSGSFGGNSTASLVKKGDGTLTLSQPTGYSGGTRIEDGEIRLTGDGDFLGSIVNDSGLVLSYGADRSFDHALAGTGYLVHNGPATTTLSSATTFSGFTEVRTGKLRIGHQYALRNSTLAYEVTGGEIEFSDALTSYTIGGLQGDKSLVLENAAEPSLPITLDLGGNGQSTYYSGNLSGGGSLLKTGGGTLSIGGAVTHSGSTAVRGGVLDVTPDGAIHSGGITVTNGGRLTSWGDVSSTGIVSVNNNPGTFTPARLEILGGTADFPQGIDAIGNGNEVFLIRLDGGTLRTNSISLARSSLNLSAGEPTEGSTTTGFYISGGDAHLDGNLYIGTVPGLNIGSSVSTRIDSGSLTVEGTTSIGVNVRWSLLDVNGGLYHSKDTDQGLIVGGSTDGNALFLVRAGRAQVERIQLGQANNSGLRVVRVRGTGELYVGSGGIVSGSTAGGHSPTLYLGDEASSGNLIGAKASWSTAVPVQLNGTGTVKAADESGAPFDIAIEGPITGSGSLVKTGGGVLTLSPDSAYTGNTTIKGGTLRLSAPTLAESGALVLDGGSVHLDFSGTNPIARLRVNGVELSGEGTWGGIGSGADHIVAEITGPGLLELGEVGPPSDPYQIWIGETHKLSGDKTGLADDYDGDGQSNLLEFALDDNPASGAASDKVVGRIATLPSGEAFVLTLPVRSGAQFVGAASLTTTRDGVTYEIQGSSSLGNFDLQVVEVIPAQVAGLPTLSEGWTYHSFRLGTPHARGFLRARISPAP